MHHFLGRAEANSQFTNYSNGELVLWSPIHLSGGPGVCATLINYVRGICSAHFSHSWALRGPPAVSYIDGPTCSQLHWRAHLQSATLSGPPAVSYIVRPTCSQLHWRAHLQSATLTGPPAVSYIQLTTSFVEYGCIIVFFLLFWFVRLRK